MVDGRGGDDVLRVSSLSGGSLVGGGGRDLIDAGIESRVDVRDTEADTIECQGLRRLPVSDRVDDFHGCVPLLVVLTSRARVAEGRVRLRVDCQAVGQRCRASIVARDPATQRIIGRGVVRAGPGRGTIRLALTPPPGSTSVGLRLRLFRERPAPSQTHRSAGFELEGT